MRISASGFPRSPVLFTEACKHRLPPDRVPLSAMASVPFLSGFCSSLEQGVWSSMERKGSREIYAGLAGTQTQLYSDWHRNCTRVNESGVGEGTSFPFLRNLHQDWLDSRRFRRDLGGRKEATCIGLLRSLRECALGDLLEPCAHFSLPPPCLSLP